MIEEQDGTCHDNHYQDRQNIQPEQDDLLEPDNDGRASRSCSEGGLQIGRAYFRSADVALVDMGILLSVWGQIRYGGRW